MRKFHINIRFFVFVLCFLLSILAFSACSQKTPSIESEADKNIQSTADVNPEYTPGPSAIPIDLGTTTLSGTDLENAKPYVVTTTFYGAKAGSDYGILWHTVNKTDDPRIIYVEDNGGEPDFTRGIVVNATQNNGMGIYVSKGVIYGLKADTTYHYIVGSGSVHVYSSEYYTIKTPKENITSFTFLNVTDTQQSTTEYSTILQAAKEKFPETAFILHTGDYVQNGGTDSEWKYSFSKTQESLKDMVTMYVSGNHDFSEPYGDFPAKVLYYHYNVSAPEQNYATGMYYSFDYGNTHFIMVNSNDIYINDGALTNEQLEWIKQDLAASNAKWKIMAIHYPLYSTGKYGLAIESSTLRNQLMGIMDKYNIDLVLQGHDHVYVRTNPILGNGIVENTETKTETFKDETVKYYVNPRGTIFQMTAVAGPQYRITNEDYSGIYDINLGSIPLGNVYSGITVEEDRIIVLSYFVSMRGNPSKIVDAYGITKN